MQWQKQEQNPPSSVLSSALQQLNLLLSNMFLFRVSLKRIFRSEVNQLDLALQNYWWCFQKQSKVGF